MVGVIWAFGSMLFVMATIHFLPLGITKMGKVISAVASFLIALAGLAATISFSLTALILLLLIIIVTYLLDQRLGKWLYIKDDFFEEGEKMDFPMVLSAEVAASQETLQQRKKDNTSEPIDLIKVNEERVSQNERKQDETSVESNYLPIEEDISFLLNRSLAIEKEHSNKIKDQNIEVDYLSEIEQLLNNEKAVENADHSNTEPPLLAEDDYEIPVLSFEDKPLKNKSETDFKSSQLVDERAEIPILPFHKKEGELS